MKKNRFLNDELRFDYFKWLVSLVNGENYMTLLKQLHRIPFTWIMTNDDNRAVDGQTLRDKFMEEVNYTDHDFLKDECSLLEMIIGLAVRINDTLVDIDEDDNLAKWFWEMLENIELNNFTDEDYTRLGGMHAVNNIVNIFLERKYKRNGSGGLFPLSDTRKDQRKIELWYQMSAYLDENYYIEDEEC